MSKEWSVRVEGVSRKFSVSLKNGLRYGLIDSARRIVGRDKDSERLRPGEFWALQDVSFELKPGDALGIMGVNGSGKTTLLRILNGTYSPDRGRVMMRGRVGSLIAAGAGFSPMLSGRENVFINATLLGLSTSEITRRFEEIVEFSGLGKFIDMPVRNYSSGMAVRLGFSIAVMCLPDILLVDEVLAVGDIAFQKRCYDKMLSARNEGTTVILVSHAVGAIWAVCNQGLFLDKGISSGKIDPEELGRRYDLQNFRNSMSSKSVDGAKTRLSETTSEKGAEQSSSLPADYGGREGGSGDVVVGGLKVYDPVSGRKVAEFDFGKPIAWEIEITVLNRIPAAIVRYAIDAVHYKFICNADSSYGEGMGLLDLEPGRYRICTVMKCPRFRPGTYTVNLAICQQSVGVHLYFRSQAGQFIVRPATEKFLYDSDSLAVVDFDTDFKLAALDQRDIEAVEKKSPEAYSGVTN